MSISELSDIMLLDGKKETPNGKEKNLLNADCSTILKVQKLSNILDIKETKVKQSDSNTTNNFEQVLSNNEKLNLK